MTDSTTRVYFFDNLKGILIILVVLGHLLELLPQSPAVQYTYMLIYAFHMPLFIFCTGYFSTEMTPKKVLCRICYPYFVWQTLYFLFYAFVLRLDGVSLSYTTPTWLMWYLFSCLLWYLIRPLFQAQTGRGALLSVGVSLALGVLIGFDRSVGRYLSLSRTVVFFPFYLLGCFAHSKKASLSQARERFNAAFHSRFPALGPDAGEKKVIPALVTALFACGMLALTLLWPRLEASRFYGAVGYGSGSLQPLFRVCQYALAAAISLFLMLIVPRTRTFLSRVGENSMVVFLLHGLLIRFLEGRLPAFVHTLPSAAVLFGALAFSLAVSLLLSAPPVKRLLSPLLCFPLPSRRKDPASVS